ncbi:hypothetical protein BH09VER1_BH09VER1_09510 [soil metagenome]
MNSGSSCYGVGAEFASPGALLEAAEKIRAAGFTHFDVFSPYPIPGMSAAVGSPRSTLGKYVFFGGLVGLLSALLLVLVPSSYFYPLVVGGKPTGFFSIPAFFPVLFETTILFSAITAFVGLFLMIGLPRWNHPLFNWEYFRKASDDGFFCVIEQADPRFSPGEVRALLATLGGIHITEIHEE